MDDTTKGQKLAANFAISWKMASNWVMGLCGVLAAFYLSLPVEQQQAIVSHLPVPAWAIPIAGAALGFFARIYPQKSLSPSEAEAKSDQPSDHNEEHPQ